MVTCKPSVQIELPGISASEFVEIFAGRGLQGSPTVDDLMIYILHFTLLKLDSLIKTAYQEQGYPYH